jgi:hypothetical protein
MHKQRGPLLQADGRRKGLETAVNVPNISRILLSSIELQERTSHVVASFKSLLSFLTNIFR